MTIMENQDTLGNQHEDNTSAVQHSLLGMTLVDESPWEADMDRHNTDINGVRWLDSGKLVLDKK